VGSTGPIRKRVRSLSNSSSRHRKVPLVLTFVRVVLSAARCPAACSSRANAGQTLGDHWPRESARGSGAGAEAARVDVPVCCSLVAEVDRRLRPREAPPPHAAVRKSGGGCRVNGGRGSRMLNRAWLVYPSGYTATPEARLCAGRRGEGSRERHRAENPNARWFEPSCGRSQENPSGETRWGKPGNRMRHRRLKGRSKSRVSLVGQKASRTGKSSVVFTTSGWKRSRRFFENWNAQPRKKARSGIWGESRQRRQRCGRRGSSRKEKSRRRNTLATPKRCGVS